MENKLSKPENIIREIDASLEHIPSPQQYKDHRASVEASAWEQIYEAYQGGWIDTIEEAQSKFIAWRVYWLLGGTALST